VLAAEADGEAGGGGLGALWTLAEALAFGASSAPWHAVQHARHKISPVVKAREITSVWYYFATSQFYRLPPALFALHDSTTSMGLPMKKGRLGTMTHDYKRNGTTCLFAALEVLQGKVVSESFSRHRHREFLRFLRRLDA
jgi:hypothetical protein